MPEAVASWRDHKNYKACLEIHHDLITAYKQDFEKYAKKSQIKYVDHVFTQVPFQLGEKLGFSKFSGEYRKRELSPALELLQKANIVSSVLQTPGQGLPLGANANPNAFKIIMVDIALTQALLGLTAEQWILSPYQAFINKGAIAEAFIGQEILAYANPRMAQSLYYWQRNKEGSGAEVDYLIGSNNTVVPVEVKSGKVTTLKSMHLFLDSHPGSPFGIRFSTNNYSIYEKIHSYPLYAAMKVLSKPEL